MTPTIAEVAAAPLRHPRALGRPQAGQASWDPWGLMHPLSNDRAFAGQAERFAPPWGEVVCVATASDGTFGVGMTSQAGPVTPIINDFFAPMLAGEPAMATERLWNMMTRSANSAFGASGLAAFAVSAVDLALWDLRGKILGVPVYELVGGPARDRTRCYATGNDLDDLRDRGFEAFKLACPVGSAAATAGIEEVERLVAGARSEVGPDADIMLDCWPVLDAAYAVRLGQAPGPLPPDVDRGLRPARRLARIRRRPPAPARTDAGRGRALAHGPCLRPRRRAASRRRAAARRAMGGRSHRGSQDRGHRGRGRHRTGLARRLQRLLRPAPVPWAARQSLGGDVRGLRTRRVADGRLALHPREWPCPPTAGWSPATLPASA